MYNLEAINNKIFNSCDLLLNPVKVFYDNTR